MKLLLLLVLCAVVAAAPKAEYDDVVVVDSLADNDHENHSILINLLIRQLIAFLRRIVRDGFEILGIPPLDPLRVEHFHLNVPAGLVNLNLEMRNILVSGIGGFIVHRSNLQLSDLSFDIDVSVPKLDVGTELYDLSGDLFTAIPLFGNGKARFVVEQFRFKAKLYLKQSDNKKSVIFDRIENASFDLPSIKSELDGVIGGGDIDNIVNAIFEDVLVDYANRFRGAISKVVARTAVAFGNPILEKLDTWRFIAPLLPK